MTTPLIRLVRQSVVVASFAIRTRSCRHTAPVVMNSPRRPRGTTLEAPGTALSVTTTSSTSLRLATSLSLIRATSESDSDASFVRNCDERRAGNQTSPYADRVDVEGVIAALGTRFDRGEIAVIERMLPGVRRHGARGPTHRGGRARGGNPPPHELSRGLVGSVGHIPHGSQSAAAALALFRQPAEELDQSARCGRMLR